MLRLYDLAERSGHCHKVKLMLGLLCLDYERIEIERRTGANRTAEFLRINPRAQLPVLEDDGLVIWDSQAILGYLGAKYGGPAWWPERPDELARVLQWLAVAQGEVQYGLQRLRAIRLSGRAGSIDEAKVIALQALALFEERLSHAHWLAADRPTVADVACYPYVALSPEGDVRLEPYPQVLGWLSRFEALPGYVPMRPRDS